MAADGDTGGTPTLDLALTEWLRGRRQAVLATSRRDGTPQTSNITFAFDGQVARVSVTDDRAKTRNLRRHPKAVLHVLGDDFWQYAAVTCTASLGAVSTQRGDEAGRDLLALYEVVGGKPHPEPDDFYRAMVDDRRLVLTLTPESATGWRAPGAS